MNFLRVTLIRVFYAALLLVAVLVLNFSLMHAAPGDVADTIAQASGGADPEALEQIRKDLRGKKPELGEFYLSSLSNLAGYEVAITPSLPQRIKTFPRVLKNIEIEVRSE